MGMLSVNSNYSSKFAANAAKSTKVSIDRSVERLSTGKRLNKAKDDTAGQAIVTRLNAEIKSLARASKNSSDAQSMVDTIEIGLKSANQTLLRMRQLALQAANGSLLSADRQSLNLEFDELIWHLERNIPNMQWGSKHLFHSEGGGRLSHPFIFQVGTGNDDSSTISVPVSQGVASVGGVIQGISAAGLNLAHGTDNIESIGAAGAVISKIDIAISAISGERAKVGAVSNRLESIIANLDQVRVNLSQSKSRLEDADFALETGNLAKSQILHQASTAMLAQANASKTLILTLIKLE
jgi:flagellin